MSKSLRISHSVLPISHEKDNVAQNLENCCNAHFNLNFQCILTHSFGRKCMVVNEEGREEIHTQPCIMAAVIAEELSKD